MHSILRPRLSKIAFETGLQIETNLKYYNTTELQHATLSRLNVKSVEQEHKPNKNLQILTSLNAA